MSSNASNSKYENELVNCFKALKNGVTFFFTEYKTEQEKESFLTTTNNNKFKTVKNRKRLGYQIRVVKLMCREFVMTVNEGGKRYIKVVYSEFGKEFHLAMLWERHFTIHGLQSLVSIPRE